jgi:hypothetical protein
MRLDSEGETPLEGRDGPQKIGSRGGCSRGHWRAARAVAFHAIQFFRGASSSNN